MPDLVTLENELTALIQERLLETGPDFSPNSNLYEEGLDSMAIMQLLILLEEKFGLMLPDADLSRQNFQTPHALAILLQTRLGESKA